VLVCSTDHTTSGTPCDKDGYDLPNGPNLRPPVEMLELIDFYPFKTRAEFEFTEFLYSKVKLCWEG
jgi:hypothetical protein